MNAYLAMVRKQLAESRWMLGISASALFGLGWLFVYLTTRFEDRLGDASNPGRQVRQAAMLRGFGGEAMDFSSTAIELVLWSHPFLILILAVWPIARGSAAPAGEIERGTIDLILSRPLGRSTYLLSHATVAALGLLVLAAGLVGGHLAGGLYYPVADPPRVLALLKPAANLAALGLAIYGYTFVVSTLDVVRWRPTMVGSTLTLAMFIALIVANLPTMEDYQWIENYSIFKAFQPVEAAVKGESFARNVAILCGIGLGGIGLGMLGFQRRDIPTNS